MTICHWYDVFVMGYLEYLEAMKQFSRTYKHFKSKEKQDSIH